MDQSSLVILKMNTLLPTPPYLVVMTPFLPRLVVMAPLPHHLVIVMDPSPLTWSSMVFTPSAPSILVA